MLLKGYRKDYHNYSNYKIKPVLEEIGKRLNVSFDIVRNLLPQEIEEGLKKGEVGDHSGRLKLFITKQVDGVNYEASDAEEMLQSVLSQEIEVRNEWKGQCAYPGKVSGTVKLVDSRKDMDKFQEGDVLVSHTTNPDLVPAMEKASAIITDMGGLTSHAAIVSREMKKPCVVGSQNASKQLKDGDRVEVDADKGIVKKI
jgi:pyruvate,water dikinase